MLRNEIVLLILIVAGLGALAWRDFVTPRRQRRTRRDNRRRAHLQGKIRTRIWADLWNLRKTRRITDQRPQDRPETDLHR